MRENGYVRNGEGEEIRKGEEKWRAKVRGMGIEMIVLLRGEVLRK